MGISQGLLKSDKGSAQRTAEKTLANTEALEGRGAQCGMSIDTTRHRACKRCGLPGHAEVLGKQLDREKPPSPMNLERERARTHSTQGAKKHKVALQKAWLALCSRALTVLDKVQRV